MNEGSDNTLADIELTHIVHASIETVSRAITTPSLVVRWLGCMRYTGELGVTFYMQPDPEKRAGDSIEGATHCELLGLTADEMSFSWFLPGTPKTTVTISLRSIEPSTTEVHLRHAGWQAFPRDAITSIYEALKGGWASGVLPQLEVVATA